MGNWKAWRRSERDRLLARRRELSAAEREAAAQAIGRRLDASLPVVPGGTLGIYWPIKGEVDLRDWALAFAERNDMTLALPVVVVEKQPLVYRRWSRGVEMQRGVWDILIPADPTPLLPSRVLAPLVGFDPVGMYRLGYGGAYFDRTLVSRLPRPLAIGIGLDFMEVTGFEPQPHDIPMDMIVTPTRTLLR
jgi:5,10-methenyltetrahydrofolate synthetase